MEDKEDQTQHIEVEIEEKDEITQIDNDDKDEGSLHDTAFQDAHEVSEPAEVIEKEAEKVE